MAPRDLENRVEVARMPVQVHGQERAHDAARGAMHDVARLDQALAREEVGRLLRVEPPRDLFRVEEDGLGAAIGDGVARRHEGEGGHEHEIARLDPRGEERHVKRGRAVDGGHGVGHAHVRRHLALEATHEGPGRGHPVGVEAFLDVLPLVAGEVGNGIGNGAPGPGHRDLASAS